MSPPDVADNDNTVNEYEALRRAKIARNEARLRELGLLEPRPKTMPRRRGSNHIDTNTTTSKKLTATPFPREPPRRSKRLREVISNSLSPSLKEEETKSPRRGTRSRAAGGTTTQSRASKVAITPSPPNPAKKPSTSTPPPNSARIMSLDIPTLLQHCLGQAVAHTGKAHVMEYAARVALVSPPQQHNTISFNKYSGVQEWQNCIFLWINRGAPNADVVNDFFDINHVTWFGGSRLHVHSPVVSKLIKASSDEETQIDVVGWPVVLWSRTYHPDQKTFGPYTCLGRLQYVSHDPNSHPLAFVFKLLDYERLPPHVQTDLHQKGKSTG